MEIRKVMGSIPIISTENERVTTNSSSFLVYKAQLEMKGIKQAKNHYLLYEVPDI